MNTPFSEIKWHAGMKVVYYGVEYLVIAVYFYSQMLDIARSFGHIPKRVSYSSITIIHASETVECTSCVEGRILTECCNGADGCSCRGQVVDMGKCLVCGGKGWHNAGIETDANINLIRSAAQAGGGYLGYSTRRR